jgi:DNA repair exonuclease SbcCD ATPase subunit
VSMLPSENRQIRLPVPERVTLHRFSLFEKRPTLTVSFGPGVTCIAGANGLGKSTFLTAMNFALTGIVPEPGREFRGVEDYYRRTKAYSESFFRGRVQPDDVEAAYVELTVRVGSNRHIIKRSVLEPDELLSYEVRANNGAAVLDNDSTLTATAKHDVFKTRIVQECGLESFAQLVFLQHFVITFDERRELLFWGPRILPAALFIAFGLDPDKAREADRLQEEARKAGSLVRNYNWQASDWRRQLENLEKLSGDVVAESEGVGAAHERLLEEQAEAARNVQRLMDELSSIGTRIAELSSELQGTRSSYDEKWRLRLRGHGHPSAHPVVTTSLEEQSCSLCGSDGPAVVEQIQAQIDDSRCPLCDSHLSSDADAAVPPADELQIIDETIVSLQNELRHTESTRQDLNRRLAKAQRHATDIAQSLAEYEEANELSILQGRGELDVVADRYRSAMADQLRRKEEQLQRRNDAQRRLRSLQRELVAAYSVAEESFVPDFMQLANEFLGLSLDVELEARKNEVRLLLSVQGSDRRGEGALSESQRFFLDIALRMALIKQMSRNEDRGALLVDTPEGSLDIAYEARAGDMFGLFVGDEFSIVMTANINTSKLLERLARRCGHALMSVERMTSWTALSEVQSREEDLFDSAFQEIEDALGGDPL